MRPGALLPALALVALALEPAVPSAAGSGGLSASLRPSHRYYYEGDAVTARLVLHNAGAASVQSPSRPENGIEIRGADGQPIDAGASAEDGGGSLPRRLEPGSTHELVIDLSRVEALRKAGAYRLRWSSGKSASEVVLVTILPRYDGSQPYIARVETNLGPIVIRLLPNISPLAVKAFVDLARAGFYDGSRFHEVRADSYVVSGDPRFGVGDEAPLRFPAEQSDLIVIPGTVVLKPLAPAPPANGSAFMISLQPRPAWTGQVTVLGQVVEGLEVVQRISRLPPATTGARQGGRPAGEARIVRVAISAEAPPGAGS